MTNPEHDVFAEHHSDHSMKKVTQRADLETPLRMLLAIACAAQALSEHFINHSNPFLVGGWVLWAICIRFSFPPAEFRVNDHIWRAIDWVRDLFVRMGT
jgi:hypothetical protein